MCAVCRQGCHDPLLSPAAPLIAGSIPHMRPHGNPDKRRAQVCILQHVVPVAKDRQKQSPSCKEGIMYPDGYGQRVLIVENDASVRSLLSVVLTYEGYSVFEVTRFKS